MKYIASIIISCVLMFSTIVSAQSSTSDIALRLLSNKTSQQQKTLEQRVETVISSITLPVKTRNLLYSLLIDIKEIMTRPGDVALATCLTDQWRTMYGADRCPHCITQKIMFWEAFQQINYVECSQQPDVCASKEIIGYPTWISPTGQQIQWTQSRASLVELSSCDILKVAGWNDLVNFSITIKDTSGRIYIDGAKRSYGFSQMKLDDSIHRRHTWLVWMTEGEIKSITVTKKNVSYIFWRMLSDIGMEEVSYIMFQRAGIEVSVGDSVDLWGVKWIIKELFDRAGNQIVLIDLLPSLRTSDLVIAITVDEIQK